MNIDAGYHRQERNDENAACHAKHTAKRARPESHDKQPEFKARAYRQTLFFPKQSFFSSWALLRISAGSL
ncbi:MAG: hypothetical protein KGJ00_04690 [Bradyrhizobium sp.]|nr:hypothetical protein [Bradyrhizobium sp.]